MVRGGAVCFDRSGVLYIAGVCGRSGVCGGLEEMGGRIFLTSGVFGFCSVCIDLVCIDLIGGV